MAQIPQQPLLQQRDAQETRLRNFLTQSSYEGAWDRQVNVMDGFGSYRYPDGSEYRGRFSQGKFHGFGHLRLAQPYRFTVKGEFENGRLVSIEDMWFADGLHVVGSFTPSGLDCSQWDYLSLKDRRYHSEKEYGQQPVGPTSFLTSKLQARTVPPGCYDVEEGIYNATSGWISDRPPPFSGSIYVGCQGDKDWIVNNCRKARTPEVIEPPPSFCREILANNLATEQEQMKGLTIYAPSGKVDHERYFHKLGKQRVGANDPEGMPSFPRRMQSCQKDDPARATEMCVRAYARMLEQHEQEQKAKKRNSLDKNQEDVVEGPRQFTSTSDVPNQDSGQSSCQSDSFGEQSMPIGVREDFISAKFMGKKRAAHSVNVVQSNLVRRSSYMEMLRSIFEL
ncbi:hypothetical protein KR018_011234 [Drosophila ironensis]|nr:hypothetical protein KR018_011234 [Drosophila ironensis]